MPKGAVTLELVRRLFRYDKETGFVYRRIQSGRFPSGAKVGSRASNGRSIWLQMSVNYKNIKVHRLIWFLVAGEWPVQIDHIDGDTLNNQWSNLRNVGNAENAKNQKLFRTNTSGVPGVSRVREKYWQARITENGKPVHLYCGNDFFEAVCIRKRAELDYGYHKNHGMRRHASLI